MKTAEQWVDESRLIVNGTSRAELVKLIRAIQEDARRERVYASDLRGMYAELQREWSRRFVGK